MKYMLDTNICIEIIRKKPTKVFERLKRIDPSDICVSSVTYSELVYGVEKSQEVERNRLALSLLFSHIYIADYNVSAANDYGMIRAELERKGTPIGPLDSMIAAHARSLGCVIVTNNEKEFSRVSGLKVENWVK